MDAMFMEMKGDYMITKKGHLTLKAMAKLHEKLIRS